jgi:hypothetical protein
MKRKIKLIFYLAKELKVFYKQIKVSQVRDYYISDCAPNMVYIQFTLHIHYAIVVL